MSRNPKILIAYDGSDAANAALTDLGRAGLGSNVQARVLAATDPWTPPLESMAVASDVFFAGAYALNRVHSTRDSLQEARALAEKGAQRLRKIFPDWKVSAGAVVD